MCFLASSLLFTYFWTLLLRLVPMSKSRENFFPTTARLILREERFKTPNTWCRKRVFEGQVSSKYGTWYGERVILNLCTLALWLALHIFDTQRWRCEPQEERNSGPLLHSCFIGSCHVGVSKRFSRSISLAVYRLSLYIFLADQISYRSTLGAFIVCGSLQFLVSSWYEPGIQSKTSS